MIRKVSMLLPLWVSMSTACCSGTVPEPAIHSVPTQADIVNDIDAVTREKLQTEREQLSKRMLHDIMRISNAGQIDTLDNRVIEGIIPLLDDESDIVRGRAACALKYFGPRARAAVPFLQKAETRILEEERKATEHDEFAMVSAYDSTACIDEALSRIRGIQ